MMDMFNFHKEPYNEVVKIIKFKFLSQIRNTGIIFNEILSANNLVTNSKFYILVCNDQDKIHYIRFKEIKVLLINLIQIAEKRLKKLSLFESELLKINDTESYGESKYFNDTEITAISISSIEELLKHFRTKMSIVNK